MQEDPNKVTYFAKSNSRGAEVPFGIKRRDRARHMYVIGKTGMGKSTLLENMAIQDIRNGEGLAFIDPHGSTADRILEYVPEHRVKDVVYFAPFDMEYPLAFNVMEDVGYDKRHLVVSGLMSAFKKLWVDAWSARMEYILSNTLLALLEYEGATLLDVNTMYTNKAFRKKVVDNVKDPVVKRFWVEEFANFTDRFAAEATPAIQNKVGQFTSNPLIRNIIGQPKSSFDIRKLMDERKIFIINLSKGRVGEVNANLLGSMLVTKIYLAAMSRADVTAATLTTLPNFYFYVDEFQNFANESFADILSEARKYKLNLLIAHQYVEQMEEEVRNAVFGNVGTTVAFRVGPFDAETLETIFQPTFMQTDLVNLGFAQIYLTLMIDGVGSPPFSATTLPPFDPPPARFDALALQYSREQFGRPRAAIEEMLQKWQESELEPAKSVAPKAAASSGASGTASASSSAPSGKHQTPHAADKPRGMPLRSDYVKPAERVVPPPVPLTPQELAELEAHKRAVAASIQKNTAAHAVAAPEPAPEPVSAPEPAPQPKPEPTPHKPVERPREPAPRPQESVVPKPPLEGATSLKDALAAAMKKAAEAPKEEVASAPAPSPEPASLKDALAKVATHTPPTPPPHNRPHPHVEPTKEPPAQMQEQVMREMLAVDEQGDETR